MGTKNNPGAYDCYEKADPDEPLFVLLGRDPTASLAVNLWICLNQKLGCSDDKIEEARKCARELETWARSKDKNVDDAIIALRQVLKEAL